MPLFSSRREPSPELYQPEPVHAAPEQHPKKHGLFHRNRDVSPASTHHTGSTTSFAGGQGADRYSNNSISGSGISRRSTDASSSTVRRSFFHRHNGGRDSLDPSILQARERVMGAEQAEVEADRAMSEARMRVREAKDHVWRLEEEAKEEARRAKIKQQQAREVSKRGKGLGRHGI